MIEDTDAMAQGPERSSEGPVVGKSRGGIFSALRGMFSFFTMMPIDISQRNIDDMDRNFWLIPIVGVFFGLVAVSVYSVFGYYVSLSVGAVLALLAIQVLNRFLHLDGTIDVGDGLTVAGGREDHIRALKDTLIGAGGMATGLLVVLLTWTEYQTIGVYDFIFFGLAAEILARNAQVSAAAFGTAGNGMAGNSVRSTGMSSLVRSSVLSAVLVAVLCGCMSMVMNTLFGRYATLTMWSVAMVSILLSVLCGYVMAKVAEKNFGMVNGDVLGATNEISRAVLLFFVIIMTATVMG
ncbi:MAG: adenosylcobinamide-GDP ribazoletransferase [Candidatus Methanomethylophilaceae archaeon]